MSLEPLTGPSLTVPQGKSPSLHPPFSWWSAADCEPSVQEELGPSWQREVAGLSTQHADPGPQQEGMGRRHVLSRKAVLLPAPGLLGTPSLHAGSKLGAGPAGIQLDTPGRVGCQVILL